MTLARSSPGPRALWWSGLGIAWVLGTVFVWLYLDRGWIPFDDGALAHGAERVLQGELPHRDYAEIYSGGLTFANAASFRIFGIHLLALRYLLFAVFVLWVPALYYVASRLAGPVTACLVTLLAVLWSVPNYPAAMPSWYNLFFATFGLAALLAYVESPRIHWLVLAGAAGGLSVLCKVSGLFFVGAGVLGLVYHTARTATVDQTESPGMPGFRILSALPLGAATAALLAIGLSRGRWEDAYQFALPGLAVTFLIWMAVFRSGAGTAESRKLVAALSWFGLGVLLPIGVFAIPYLASDSLGDLYRGLFVVPRRRFEFSASLPQSPLGAGPVLATAALLLAGRWIPRRFLRAYWLGVVVVLGAAMVLSGRDRRVHDFLWDSVAQALPLATLALTAMIARASRSDNGASAQTSRWVFIAITTTFCALIQYPFAIPVYFCYVVPLVWVLLIPLGQRLAEGNRPALIAFGGAYLVFGALFLEPFRLEGLSGPFDPVPLARLDSGRGGLLIGSEQARLFAETLAAVQSHAGTGVIYAGPDAPEIYFLTGLRNPTPALFDFAVPDSLFRRKLMAEIESNRISAVVIKRPTTGTILHSAFLEPEVFQALERRFPRYQDIDGRFTRFTIRWSDQPAVR